MAALFDRQWTIGSGLEIRGSRTVYKFVRQTRVTVAHFAGKFNTFDPSNDVALAPPSFSCEIFLLLVKGGEREGVVWRRGTGYCIIVIERKVEGLKFREIIERWGIFFPCFFPNFVRWNDFNWRSKRGKLENGDRSVGKFLWGEIMSGKLGIGTPDPWSFMGSP